MNNIFFYRMKRAHNFIKYVFFIILGFVASRKSKNLILSLIYKMALRN